MNRIFSIVKFALIAILTSLTFACSARYEIQNRKDVMEEVSYQNTTKEALTKACVLALTQRNWEIESVSNPIRAKFFSEKNNISAKIRIFVKDNSLIFDLSGSMKDGEPFAPKEYITYLKASVLENLQGKA